MPETLTQGVSVARKQAGRPGCSRVHPGAQAPWQRVQIDSTPCDILLVTAGDRRVIGRPNVTFAIDVFSRAVLGFWYPSRRPRH
jgi:putative transposase